MPSNRLIESPAQAGPWPDSFRMTGKGQGETEESFL